MTSTNPPLIQRLHAQGIPFLASPEHHDRTVADSATAVALKATITDLDGNSERGVAIFAGRRYPAIVLTREAAERIADELDQILAAQSASEWEKH